MAKCRNLGSITMCPSFQVTREEMHSTRGRARLLFEMLKGEPVGEGWRSDAVKESLDLCLSCKGCTGGCPVHVDIPTYKAEFLSHYYARRLRPPAHYLLGLIPWWGAAASRLPRVANAISHAPKLAPAAKRALGLAPERDAPRFARKTFRAGFVREAGGRQRGRVLLFPDTFTDLFEPAVGDAAVEVLEAAGFDVEIPRRRLCCGRPLYDFGMLGIARWTLRRTLDELSREIEAGVPMLVLEPSCAAVFRDELLKLMPHDEHAQRLGRQTFTLDELLEREAGDWSPPQLDRTALVHGHCHQEAVFGLEGQLELLRRTGLHPDPVQSGCCGLAGSFGYQNGDPYEVSVQAGERILLPAVRAAEQDALVVSDGFSCRTQIHAGTGRQALHTAQVLQLALKNGA
jgi:Fe-S oxidoreductase